MSNQPTNVVLFSVCSELFFASEHFEFDELDEGGIELDVDTLDFLGKHGLLPPKPYDDDNLPNDSSQFFTGATEGVEFVEVGRDMVKVVLESLLGAMFGVIELIVLVEVVGGIWMARQLTVC